MGAGDLVEQRAAESQADAEALVKDWPPLTEAQKARLRVLLRPTASAAP